MTSSKQPKRESSIGNILRHEYQRADSQIIWKAVKDDLPAQGSPPGNESCPGGG
ncbi:HepT-like ribonuclease domain-containing protein [Bradyrhizobium sp. ORS 111]|uniref:HepT-like ribonuclease domain-containing protein n=1 Tax=Bradyrhizobium sp. ORS 111 TaxID=1685958 RepID=UPI00388F16C5